MAGRFLGIFLNPIYAQHEGIGQVFDNLERAGATAVCTTPYLPYVDENGVRFPDLHIDGQARVLSRTLWGRRELRLQQFPAFAPSPGAYPPRYRPRSRPTPEGLEQHLIRDVVHEGHRRGLQVHLQLQPFVLPSLQPADQPRLVDGTTPESPLVAESACLNNPTARRHLRALVMDVLGSYPEVDGLFIDWAEFSAYRLEDSFACFCPHCEAKARRLGFDWTQIKREMLELWQDLHHLDDAALRHVSLVGSGSPALQELQRFKAISVGEVYREVRDLIAGAAGATVELSARGWPPPWNLVSGLDYRDVSSVCSAVTPKLFLFDYHALPRWYGEQLMAWNPSLGERAAMEALERWLELPLADGRRPLSEYRIPAPDEPHPFGPDHYLRRVERIARQLAGESRLYPFAHAYLSDEQWCEMLMMLREGPVDGIWVQMYGYLSDRKIDVLASTWR